MSSLLIRKGLNLIFWRTNSNTAMVLLIYTPSVLGAYNHHVKNSNILVVIQIELVKYFSVTTGKIKIMHVWYRRVEKRTK